MAQCLKTLAALPVDSSSIPSNHMVTHNQISVFHGTNNAHDTDVDIHAKKMLIHVLKWDGLLQAFKLKKESKVFWYYTSLPQV